MYISNPVFISEKNVYMKIPSEYDLNTQEYLSVSVVSYLNPVRLWLNIITDKKFLSSLCAAYLFAWDSLRFVDSNRVSFQKLKSIMLL